MNDTKSDLVRHLELTAEWRAEKAEQYPDEPRHARSAEALARAAQEVAALGSDDPRLGRIRQLYYSGDEEAIAVYDGESSSLVIEHGFTNAAATTDKLLDGMAAIAAKAGGMSFGVGLPPKNLR